MYQVGDKVVNPMHGAGIIDSIFQRQVGGNTPDYYLIKLYAGRVMVIPTHTR